MSDPIIPSTAEVRAGYIRDHTRNFDSYMVGRSLTSEQEFYGEKFDRWLAARDAAKRAEWEAEQGGMDVAALREARAETWDEAIATVFAWWSAPEGERPALIVNPYGVGVPVEQEGE